MRALPFIVRGWSIGVTLGLCVACAADAGDPSKLVGSGGGVSGTVDSGGGGMDVESPPVEDSSAAGSDVGSAAEAGSPDSGADGGSAETGSLDDASAPEADGGGSTSDGGESADALACLRNIPSNCACMTQNASDEPICEKYVSCFADNDCNPSDACGSNDGVCGVNTLGGGGAPLAAAVQTYNCACP
jgi:hypothetical protein